MLSLHSLEFFLTARSAFRSRAPVPPPFRLLHAFECAMSLRRDYSCY
jgi:hypothetical protein